MVADFPRILTLLRKEKGISQKEAARELGISQALLSHYEKGIRECGLEFLVKAANFYHVSCDYLLGRSPDREGAIITVEDIPEPDSAGKENVFRGSILPVLNKKLILNSLNIVFDFLQKANNRTLINEVSAYLMLAVYKMIRALHLANPKNSDGFFTIPKSMASKYADSAMAICEAKVQASVTKQDCEGIDPVSDETVFALSTEKLSQDYPLFSSSLLNLIQNSENKISGKTTNK